MKNLIALVCMTGIARHTECNKVLHSYFKGKKKSNNQFLKESEKNHSQFYHINTGVESGPCIWNHNTSSFCIFLFAVPTFLVRLRQKISHILQFLTFKGISGQFCYVAFNQGLDRGYNLNDKWTYAIWKDKSPLWKNQLILTVRIMSTHFTCITVVRVWWKSLWCCFNSGKSGYL